MKKYALTLLALTVMMLAATAPASAGDAAAGKKKTQTCAACHGADGNASDPQYPRLAGQYATYLEHALHAYQTGERQNPIMKGFAAPLSDQDIADIAAYYASLPSKLDDLAGHVQGDD